MNWLKRLFRQHSAPQDVKVWNIRGDRGALAMMFYLERYRLSEEKTQMVCLGIGGEQCSLTLESFWRQMTEIMDDAAGREPGALPGNYDCDSCGVVFSFASKSGEPLFCPHCGHAGKVEEATA
jgi:hypothetical protein